MIDIAVAKSLVGKLHAVVAERAFGQPGIDALFEILETVQEVYRYVEPCRIKGEVTIFRSVGADDPARRNLGQVCGGLQILGTLLTNGFVLEVQADGTRILYPHGIFILEELARTSVVYTYRERREYFIAGSDREEMFKLDPSADSQFAVPTFFTLREALRRYATEQIRYSGCPIFNDAWADPNRLFFKPAPELYMRRSLTNFLKNRLTAAFEVRPEQVMDESHPVDIKVTYSPAHRLMIIEIKWLGTSRNEAGGVGTPHRDGRAKEGAKQLAGYLDQNKAQAPWHATQGYYVIIDARRRGLREDSATISRENGMYYASAEIDFDPEYHRVREDFDPPYRMFAEPVCEP